MRVNMNKTKVMISGEWLKVTQKAVRWPCGVCGRGVGNNSIQCTSWGNPAGTQHNPVLGRRVVYMMT